MGRRTLRLALCATAAGLALAAQTASANVVVVDFSANALSTVPFNLNGVYINVVTGAVGTTGSSTTGWDLNPYYSGSGGSDPMVNLYSPSGGGAAVGGPLTPGSTVDAGTSFSSIVGVTQPDAGTYYYGFRFLNEATSQTDYGYVTMQQTTGQPLSDGSMRLVAYAYEDAGGAITVAAVPEPSTALMMMGGLLAAGALRKRLGRRDAS